MEPEQLKQRTKTFGLRVIELVEALPKSRSAEVIGRQLLRAATSVGANYRAACRARSQADFVSKITVVEEEADEACFWLEMLREARLMNGQDIGTLLNEANELTAIFTASGKTAKRGRWSVIRNRQSEIREVVEMQSAIGNPKSAMRH